MDKNILDQEKSNLVETIIKITSAKEGIKKAMDSLGADNLSRLSDLRNNPETSGGDFLIFLQQLHEKNESFNLKDKLLQVEELEYLAREPYFARIDIKDKKNAGLEERLYIGKFGYTEDVPLIIDWRAKVASLYYRYRYPQKNVQYETPEGTVIKDLNLKRTFEIDDGELIKYYNNDLQLDENEIIVDKIEGRTGGVLEDIIETIQINQLDIIEADPRQVCIVQGCVGSGKSTVAIHKLSHIFFNFPHLVEPQRAILVAKNPVLVKYLATLFPKLGIFDINYKTLRDLVINVVFREDMKIQLDLDNTQGLKDVSLESLNTFRSHLKYVHNQYETEITKVLESEEFAGFGSFVYQHSDSILENINELINDLEEEVSFEKEKIEEAPDSLLAEKYNQNVKTLKKLVAKLKKYRIELHGKTLPEVLTTLDINAASPLGYKDVLIYILVHFELFGYNKYYQFQYCVVDEGQDFSVLEYAVLDRLVQKGRFTILGDLNQSYLGEGLTTWKTIEDVITQTTKAQTFELNTNYRSTRQIIDYANSLLAPFTSEYLPMSINRQGADPNIRVLSEDAENTGYVDEVLSSLKESVAKNNNKSACIICFDQKDFEIYVKKLTAMEKSGQLGSHTFIKLENNKNVAYIPKGVYLTMFENCKGLEFSKVYVIRMPKIEGFSTAKKAFVAATRAMNELTVYLSHAH